MGANSTLFKEHAEWAVQHSPGVPSIATQNWGQDCYALDLTRPEVIDWLGEVFRTVSDDWDFDYVKIDFIYAGAVDGIRHDPSVTRAQAYRRGLQAIRDAVGDKFILACGNPMGQSIGVVDGARIGPDVAPHWRPYEFEARRARSIHSEPSAVNSIRNTITRYWMHDRLWQNDPDCLMVRATDTTLSGDEVRCLATVIGLTGGMVLDSDDMTKLSDERREIISMLLPVYGRSAVPEDLFASEIPERLVLDLERAPDDWRVQLGRCPRHSNGCGFPNASRTCSTSGRSSISECTAKASSLKCRHMAAAFSRFEKIGTARESSERPSTCCRVHWSSPRTGMVVPLPSNCIPVAKKRGEIYLFVPPEIGAPSAAEVEITSRGDNLYGIHVEVREPRTIVIEFAR